MAQGRLATEEVAGTLQITLDVPVVEADDAQHVLQEDRRTSPASTQHEQHLCSGALSRATADAQQRWSQALSHIADVAPDHDAL